MPYNLSIKGWMYEEELKVIESLAQKLPPGSVIAEVGSFCGRSAICWAMSADPSTTIYCFDPFFEHLTDNNGEMCNSWEEFQKNTAEFKNIIPIRGLSPQHAKYTDPRPIDIFFIDATHINPSDWNIISHFVPFIKSGGIIAGHDYTSYSYDRIAFPDVNFNVHRLEEMFNQKAKITTTFWYFIKP